MFKRSTKDTEFECNRGMLIYHLLGFFISTSISVIFILLGGFNSNCLVIAGAVLAFQ